MAALGSTFAIVEHFIDAWALEMLDEEIRRPHFGPDWVHTQGWVLQRVFSHDVYHCGELSQTLGAAGLPQIDLWDLSHPTYDTRVVGLFCDLPPSGSSPGAVTTGL